MNHNQLTRAMTKLGITQAQLAILLATNARTVRRWMTGDWPVPAPVSLLLNLMLDTGKSIEDLRA